MKWTDVKQWAAPLGIFIAGELLFLFFLLFTKTIDTQVAVTANQTAAVASTFWGWEWAMKPGVARSVGMTGYQLFLMICVGIAFLKSKY